jgi:hypothetical protein
MHDYCLGISKGIVFDEMVAFPKNGDHDRFSEVKLTVHS